MSHWRAGVTVTVSPGESVLKSIEESGQEVAYSCWEGVCGTCMTTVLEGKTVRHRASRPAYVPVEPWVDPGVV
ncbi:2Fe-2S iron-sulfur cluster binding domain-containing protein [Saccharopolyspora sp. NPDC049426]|uniref:2Fe-2S iron-sulfur cluster-binding protein n=1 Tax=Saccharopolyspora sp. NPDC049426 TaxID=3155652 RepID=UPI00341A0703